MTSPLASPRPPLSDTGPFVVLYWSGGREVGSWHRLVPAYPTRQAAEAELASIVRAGRPGYVNSQQVLEVIGWPVGAPPRWDFERLRWR